ncbi:MAG: DEAD/DEAH box helicase, partial [Spirochaeta sp.]|nr:DEAD/DEAH box helicase [Spirochaeta sp.]
MNETITDYARSRFGLSYLYPYQRLVITNILAAVGADGRGADGSGAAGHADSDAGAWGRQIVILPTGAGKSLCFQLPAAILGGATLVIYPLLSLMNDQERRITEAGFTVVQLKGGQDRRERDRVAAAIITGTCDFVLTNPETLQGARAQKLLRNVRIDHVVIDEAHCISEWGDTFRESYLTLGDSLRPLNAPVITAFTATASDHVIRRIREVVFPDTGAHLVRGNPDRENITYSVVPCLDTRHAVVQLARSSCGAPPGGASAENLPGHPAAVKERDGTVLPVWRRGDHLALPAIVFCRTRAETETVAAEVAQVLGTD